MTPLRDQLQSRHFAAASPSLDEAADTTDVSWSPPCRKPAHATDGQRLRRRMEARVEERGRQAIATKERRLTVRQAPKMPVAGRRDPPRRKDMRAGPANHAVATRGWELGVGSWEFANVDARLPACREVGYDR